MIKYGISQYDVFLHQYTNDVFFSNIIIKTQVYILINTLSESTFSSYGVHLTNAFLPGLIFYLTIFITTQV